MGETETTESKSNVVSETISFPIFCPACGGKLQGLVNGQRDNCGYDDCRANFSLRFYDVGLQHKN